jgi:uncharacterized protein YcnI
MKKKLSLSISTCLIALFAFAGFASAHVVVFPKQVTQGTYEKFTVRVPTEKDVPTVKVKVIIPKEAAISRFEPKPGWKYEIEKDNTDLITSVTWTATNGGLLSTEFGEFNMQGKVADDAEKIVWNAYQTYQDGSTVAWEGPSEAEHPASITEVMKATNGDSGHGAVTKDEDKKDDMDDLSEDQKEESKLPLYLSIGALVLSLIALISAFKKR